MRILHTSDWHLGRTLHGVDLHEHHEAFHDALVRTVRERAVDVVLVAGDVYDRAIPPVQSVGLLSRTLARLAEITTVVLTPGNHDSAVRLGFGREIMRAGIHILADAPGIEHPVTVADEHGEVLFFGLPYLEPDIARFTLAGDGEDPLARSHEAVMAAAMDRVRARLLQRREAAAAAGEAAPRAVVLAHAFVAGGAASDSERDLAVGGIETVPGPVFAGVDYIALGHLHGCQDLSSLLGPERGSSAMWYSGSPLPYSLSEKDHRKAMVLVELGERGVERVERIPVPQPRRITELRGPLEEILAGAAEHGEDWLFARVTDPQRPAHMQETLRGAYPHLLQALHEPEGRERTESLLDVRSVRDPLAVMDEFMRTATGAAPAPAEREVLEAAWHAVRAREAEAS